ncbi:uncharacterized protein LOC105829669 [Monomorium pharaonis]|uniref:uncharacterized protein LOC105829669 n=1 Tax=Monomorium pharaonis TaxID=307658 RepID=UPI00063F63F5|nr:uncharacterized protein LOC105829669 [Monomorium pharaonis]
MPGYHQPNSLEGLSLGCVCQQLIKICQRLQMLSQQSSTTQMLAFAKQTIRPYYINGLPIYLRSQVIKITLRMLNNPSVVGLTLTSVPDAMYILILLLNNNIKQLKINLCCYYGCSHQTSLLKLLALEGVGLESLNLTRSTLLSLDCQLLQSALLNMKNLSNLILRNIASDSVLEIIGKSCPKLVILDIACSKQVTNTGLKQLLFQMELQDKVSVSSKEHTSWSRFKRMFRTWEIRNFRSEKRFYSEKVLPFMEYKNRNSLCNTLRVLNIANTAVTSLGVLLALMQIPQLESLAEYNYMEHVAEITHKLINLKVPFNLTEAKSSKTTSFNIKLLAQVCPRVNKLHIYELYHSPDMLCLFPHITSLSIYNVPPKKKWLKDFYNYLQTNGQNLSELNIQMAQNHNPLQVDLRKILSNCPNIHTLIKNGSNIVWTKGRDPPPFKYLKKIQLGCTVKALVITKIFLLVPELTALHIHSCLDLTNKHLKKLLKPSIIYKNNQGLDECNNLQNLTCFYISEASKVSMTVLLNIVRSYKQLKWFGNLAKWDLDNEDVEMLRTIINRENINVNLCFDSHWYWNNCGIIQ